MSKPAFAPGPYEVSPLYLKYGNCNNDGSIAVCATDEDGDGFPICRVNTRQKVKRGMGHTIVCPERDATAHLLSAATDMYEALEAHKTYEAIPADRGGSNGPRGKAWADFILKREMALAKARGQK